MHKLYRAKIKTDIPDSYNDIENISRFAGKEIYITDNHLDGYEYGTYRGTLKNNVGFSYYWNEGCFEWIIEAE
jgi:hypothetical protein